jgi:hypothetical protein
MWCTSAISGGIRGERNFKFTSVHGTHAKGPKIAWDIARNQHSELLIYGRDIKSRERDSFENDNYASKG